MMLPQLARGGQPLPWPLVTPLMFDCLSAGLCRLEMSGNIFFNPIPSHSQWFITIPIPNPMFSLVKKLLTHSRDV